MDKVFKIIKNIEVPTGNILVVKGGHGELECLSLGDYGQNVNVKASFLGLEGHFDKVFHQALLPLSEKWVITISTQYGCSMGCKFCDVPLVGAGRNCSWEDLRKQLLAGISLHPEIKYTNRLNIHFARMGEPTWNIDVIGFARSLKNEIYPVLGDSIIHPVVSTMMPKHNRDLDYFLDEWVYLKNHRFDGNAGLQLSINSTSDAEREIMFNNNSLSLNEISAMMKFMDIPRGRKYTLNFAVAGYEINAEKLRDLFNPNNFIIKLTPMHKTMAAQKNGIETEGDYTTHYPYDKIEKELKEYGFDVLVFMASDQEDLSRITCGNAILSGTMPLTDYRMIVDE